MIAHAESAELAEAAHRRTVEPRKTSAAGTLTLHADRGTSDAQQASRCFAGRSGRRQDPQPPACLGRQSFLGSSVQDAQVPARLPRSLRHIEDARALRPPFLPLVQHDHRHSGIGLMTPETVHYGRAPALFKHRAEILQYPHSRRTRIVSRARSRSRPSCPSPPGSIPQKTGDQHRHPKCPNNDQKE